MKKHFLLFSACLLAMSSWAATISLSPGNKVIYNALKTISEGDVLELAAGTYTESSSMKPTVAFTLQAAPDAEVTIQMSTRFEVKAATVFKNVKMVATAETEAVRMVPGETPYSVSVQGCTLEGFTKALRVYNTDQTAPYVSNLTVDNCQFYVPAGYRGIEAASADKQLAALSITNTTFTGKTGGGRFVYLQVSNEQAMPLTIDHCTFYNSTETRAIYLADVRDAMISNCIFMNAEYDTSRKSYCIYGTTSKVVNSISYRADAYIRSDATSTNLYVVNPHFVDAANGNFQLYRNSIAVGAATDKSNLGDPRWGVSTQDYPKGDEPYQPYKQPYSTCPTTNSVKILWQMNDEMEATAGRVIYGTDADHLTDTIVTDAGWNVVGEGYVHIVTLTGLNPNTRYFYRVGDETRLMQDFIGQTRTAPEAGTAFRLFTISDIHGNSCNNWSNMQDSICALNPNICVMNGDMVSSKGDDRNWNSYFFSPGAPFLSQVPIMSAIGNHESGDPQTYRWSTFYDYFHQFSHGVETDSIQDPRGEAYFTFHYGCADIICWDNTAEPASPSLDKDALMWQWMDSVLNASTAKWILAFSHVGIHTSGYHGQWEDGQTKWGTLFEKYTKQGKRIISLHGDDHSFEHLYKDGVHYLRPGCGRNSNYAQQTQLKDAQYSMFYRQISCYSTLDFSADGNTIELTARDSAHNVFYTYTFKHDGVEGISNLSYDSSPASTVKRIEDHQLHIHYAGQTYTVWGTEVKYRNVSK